MSALLLERLRIDGGTQSRAMIDLAVVAEYAAAMAEGSKFPPVDVRFDGTDYWLADGFHRYHAARKLGLLDINAKIKNGTRRDAVLDGVGANATNGMRRTNADKRRSVMTLLGDEEWRQWSNPEIGRRCAVDESTVRHLREELSLRENRSDTPPKGLTDQEERTYTDRHGNVGTMDTSRIGRRAQTAVGGSTPEEDKPVTVNEVTEAYQFAEMALSQLSRIRHDDPQQFAALMEVRNWIDSRLLEVAR